MIYTTSLSKWMMCEVLVYWADGESLEENISIGDIMIPN